mmetsp:Transcript_675/g.1961  ORF Transcript_675/g.1961 Transcript_675/m.1961 type:complete len:264 (+) Transcript_675:699-1490(+)
MSILALLPIGALPEPAILLLLYSLQEELTNDGCRICFLLCMLVCNNLFQLLLIPVLHVLPILRILALVGEQVNLGLLPLHIQIVAVLALEALGALAHPKVLAHDGLGVHTRRRLGLLNCLCEQLIQLPGCLLLGFLLSLLLLFGRGISLHSSADGCCIGRLLHLIDKRLHILGLVLILESKGFISGCLLHFLRFEFLCSLLFSLVYLRLGRHGSLHSPGTSTLEGCCTQQIQDVPESRLKDCCGQCKILNEEYAMDSGRFTKR